MRKELFTIVYYTASKEEESFEDKIRQKILEVKGSIPLISVSQKPIDFGRNICIGNKGASYANAARQLLIGLKEVKTPYALAAEADELYPPEYFCFIPPSKEKAYRYGNVWIMYKWIGPQNKNMFWNKSFTEGGTVCGTEYWIKRITECLHGNIDDWDNDKVDRIFHGGSRNVWSSNNPLISVKTGNGLRKFTYVEKDAMSAEKLNYWGNINDLRKELFYESVH